MTSHETRNVQILDENDIYDVIFNCVHDTFQYGSDADGNKGESRTELIDYDIYAVEKNGKTIPMLAVPLWILEQARKEVER